MLAGQRSILTAAPFLARSLLTLIAIFVVAGHSIELAKFLGGAWTKGGVRYHDAYMTLLASSGLMLLVAGFGNKNDWALCLVGGAVTTLLATVRLLVAPMPADFILITLESPVYFGPLLAFVAYIGCVWLGNRALCKSLGNGVMLIGVIIFPLMAFTQNRFFLFGGGLSHVVVLTDVESFVQSFVLLVLVVLALLRDGLQMKRAIRHRSPAEQADNR